MHRTLPIVASVMGLLLAVCASASAEPRATADTGAAGHGHSARVPFSDFSVQGGHGVFVDPHAGIGFTLDAIGLRRSGPFDYGAGAEVGTQIFGYSYLGLAGALGVGARTERGLRFDVLALGGSHSYVGVGSALFSDDPGAGGTVPFVGGRVIASYSLFRGAHHVTLGLGGSYADDLSRRHVTYDFQESDWGNPPYTAHADHVVGTERLGLSVQIGGSFDVH